MTTLVSEGDRVFDPLDKRWRTVSRVDEEQVFMTDGGVMGVGECKEVRLPGEPLRIYCRPCGVHHDDLHPCRQ